MKPCTDCGLAIQNNSRVCEECGAHQYVNESLDETSGHGNADRNAEPPVSLIAFLAELVIRTLLVAMLPVCVLIAVLYFVVPLKYAIVAGAAVGVLLGFVYTLLEMHFQNQPYLGPKR